MTVASARFLHVEKPQVVLFAEYLKGKLTGQAPDLGEVRAVDAAELHRGS